MPRPKPAEEQVFLGAHVDRSLMEALELEAASVGESRAYLVREHLKRSLGQGAIYLPYDVSLDEEFDAQSAEKTPERRQIVQVTGQGIDNAERPLSPGTKRFEDAVADFVDHGALRVSIWDENGEPVRRVAFAAGQWAVVDSWVEDA